MARAIKKLKKRAERMEFQVRVISKDNRAAIKAKAKRYTNGNVSAWLRHTGEHYTPRKGEKIHVPKATAY